MPHPYCLPADVKAELPHWAAEFGTDPVPDDASIAAKIEEMDNLIDSYLEQRFAVPFGPVPATILRASRDLTIAELMDRLTARYPEGEQPGPNLRARTMAYLRDLAKGVASLDSQGAEVALTEAGAAQRPLSSWDDDASDPTFTRGQVW